MKKVKVWHFSDSHTFQRQLSMPEGTDIVIFSGDCSNPRDVYISERECRDFIEFYKSLPVKHKIFVAGNHDVAIERNRVTPADFAEAGIIYLENNSTIVEGFKIWGSPITPTFGVGWAFNKDRSKIHKVWDSIPDDTDIVVAHGPAKGILDLSLNMNDQLEYCGCENLRKRIFTIQPQLFCFGHIHNTKGVFNQGYTKLTNIKTIFSNGSIVMDGRFDYGAINNGNIFELEKEENESRN